ncbi:MAG TPA: tetratricopeptide repeat protein, partial [Candidatus Acidoferrales bacterium]|nr:tetratricopeptide repeat protein [Candidatus Acidoferrales bacterium]
LDDAVAEFRRAIDVDAKFTPAYNNLADALAQQGKLDEAAQLYERSLAAKPSAAVYNALGAVLGRLGKTDEAAAQFAKAKALEAGH